MVFSLGYLIIADKITLSGLFSKENQGIVTNRIKVFIVDKKQFKMNKKTVY